VRGVPRKDAHITATVDTARHPISEHPEWDLGVSEAHELASLVGSLSVTSPHTIHKGINRKTLFDCAALYDVALSERVKDVLSAPVPGGTYDDA